MYMDDIKLFAKMKKKKKRKTLIHAVRIHDEDIGMEFDIEKWAMRIGKWHMIKGKERHIKKKIRTIEEKETYK